MRLRMLQKFAGQESTILTIKASLLHASLLRTMTGHLSAVQLCN